MILRLLLYVLLLLLLLLLSLAAATLGYVLLAAAPTVATATVADVLLAAVVVVAAIADVAGIFCFLLPGRLLTASAAGLPAIMPSRPLLLMSNPSPRYPSRPSEFAVAPSRVDAFFFT